MSTIYRVRSVFIVIGLVTTSCFAGNHGNDNADDEPSLLDACHGRYRCTDVVAPEFHKSVTFSRQSDGCYVNDERVGAPELSIDGDRDSFVMCEGSTCYDCVRASGTPSKDAQCTGSATSCSSVGASSCAWQSGCHYT